jgi:uncharacterized membrane protein SirB2
MQSLLEKLSDPSAFILTALLILAIAGLWQFAEATAGEDYYTAWVAADSIESDSRSYVYAGESRAQLAKQYKRKAMKTEEAPRLRSLATEHKKLWFTGSPFLYAVIGLLSTGDFEVDHSVWQALSLISFVAGVLVYSRLLGYSAIAAMVLLLPLLVWFEPLQSELRVANVNCVQVGLASLILFLLSRGERAGFLFAAGVTMGLSAMFKPNMAPVAMLVAGAWLVRQRWHKLAIGSSGIGIGIAAAYLSGLVFVGRPGAWIDWWDAFRIVATNPAEQSLGNFSSFNLLFGAQNENLQIATALALVSLTLACLWWGRRGSATRDEDPPDRRGEVIEYGQLVALGCLVQTLASALVWQHYLVLAVPMLVVAFRPWTDLTGRNPSSALLHRVLPAAALALLMGSAVLRFFDSTIEYWMFSSMAGITILFLLGLWQLKFRSQSLS